MQRRGKHSSTTDLLLEMVLHNPKLGSCNSWTTTMETVVFSMRSAQRGYKDDNWGDPVTTRVEAGSNTSTVNLRVVGGDEDGSLKSETVKCGREYQGTRTRERLRWQGPAAYTKDRPVLSSERAHHKRQDRNQMGLDTKTY
jgi:hypothetical protein